MIPVAAKLGFPDIVDNHVPDFFAAMLILQKVAGESRRRDLGDVLVFGDGQHLLFGQAAKPHAIFQRDHERTLPVAPFMLYWWHRAAQRRMTDVKMRRENHAALQDGVRVVYQAPINPTGYIRAET